jgi:hypothetical protein
LIACTVLGWRKYFAFFIKPSRLSFASISIHFHFCKILIVFYGWASLNKKEKNKNAVQRMTFHHQWISCMYLQWHRPLL